MKRWFGDQSGTTMIEYGLIIALMTLVAIVGFQMVSHSTSNTYSKVTSTINNAGVR